MLKSGLASNGVYRAISVTRDAVVSYTAFPPLPVTWRYISVALSLELPPPDVIRHPALRSPDFPRLYVFRQCSRDHSPYLVLHGFIIWLRYRFFNPFLILQIAFPVLYNFVPSFSINIFSFLLIQIKQRCS